MGRSEGKHMWDAQFFLYTCSLHEPPVDRWRVGITLTGEGHIITKPDQACERDPCFLRRICGPERKETVCIFKKKKENKKSTNCVGLKSHTPHWGWWTCGWAGACPLCAEDEWKHSSLSAHDGGMTGWNSKWQKHSESHQRSSVSSVLHHHLIQEPILHLEGDWGRELVQCRSDSPSHPPWVPAQLHPAQPRNLFEKRT